MRTRVKLALSILLPAAVVLLFVLLLRDKSFDILQPAGVVAEKQRNLLIFATLLSLLVILPVYALTIFIAWKYRASNTSARYDPTWSHNTTLESIWWGIPCAIILVLAVVTWNSSHDLDPYKPISSGYRPVKVQVIAMQWKWLFIYPEQQIATVNFLQIPTNTPIEFEITADAPMNSFWIPRLGGQVYAMPGMSTRLHLTAEQAGEYSGLTANISGEGYAKMRFTARATNQAEFFEWIQGAKGSPRKLDAATYRQLAVPSSDAWPATYVVSGQSVYNTVIDKYMLPAEGSPAVHGAAGHKGNHGSGGHN